MFAGRPGIEVASAGVDADADATVTAEDLAWADLVLVMERGHRRKLQARFRSSLGHARLVCLEIPDRYGYMDPDLVRVLEERVPRHLRGVGADALSGPGAPGRRRSAHGRRDRRP